MANLGDAGNFLRRGAFALGTGMMAAAGPGGRAAAASMINTEKRIAAAEADARIRAKAEREQQTRQTSLNMMEGLVDMASKANRATADGANDVAKAMTMISELGARANLDQTTIDSYLTRAEGSRAAPEIKEEYEEIKDEKGRVIAQRNKTTNKVIVDPRASGLYSPEVLAQKIKIAEAGRDVYDFSDSGGEVEEPAAPGMDIKGAALAGTGPAAAVKQGISNVFGPFISGQLFPETTQARQQLGLFNKNVQKALINNPRFPVAEQAQVRGLVPSTEEFFTDPDDAREKVISLENYLKANIAANERSIKSARISPKRKEELASKNEDMRSVLGMIGGPSEGPQPGTVEDGYEFTGGDPADPNNWKPVQ